MAIEWINDDLTLKPGFEQNLPAEVRDYAKDAKDLPGLIKRGADTQRELHSRIKVPDTPEGKREVLNKHFKDVLDADAAATKKTQEEAEAKARTEREAAATEAQKKNLEAAQANAKKVLGGEDAKAVETNTELARRAFRGEHCPEYAKARIAEMFGVEPGKLTDEQIKQAIASDPAVADTLLRIGRLTRDGRTEHSDGHTGNQKEEMPLQPKCPELGGRMPKGSPQRNWYENRGHEYGPNGEYLGQRDVTI